MGAFPSFTLRLGGTGLLDDMVRFGHCSLTRRSRNRGSGASIKTVVYLTVVHFLKSQFSMAQSPLAQYITCLPSEQHSDSHRQACQSSFGPIGPSCRTGGNLTIKKMEHCTGQEHCSTMLSPCFTGLSALTGLP